MTAYTFHTPEDSQTVIVCDTHAKEMPAVGGNVSAEAADPDCACAFCPKSTP